MADPARWGGSALERSLLRLRQELERDSWRQDKVILGKSQLEWAAAVAEASAKMGTSWQLLGLYSRAGGHARHGGWWGGKGHCGAGEQYGWT